MCLRGVWIVDAISVILYVFDDMLHTVTYQYSRGYCLCVSCPATYSLFRVCGLGSCSHIQHMSILLEMLVMLDPTEQCLSLRMYPTFSPSARSLLPLSFSLSLHLPAQPSPSAHTWAGRQIPVGYQVTHHHGNRWEGSSINHLERGRSGGRPDCSG